MNTFRLKPAGVKDANRRFVVRMAPALAIGALIGLYVATTVSDAGISFGQTLVVAIPLIALALFIGFRIAIRNQREQWNTFSLQLSEDQIVKKQGRLAPIVIPASDWKKTRVTRKGFIIILGRNFAQRIVVPPEVDRQQELVAELEKLMPLERK